MPSSRYLQIAKIIIKKTEGELSPQEQALLDEWLAKSSYNEVVYERIINGESRKWHMQNLSNLDYSATIEGIKMKIAANRKTRILKWSVSAAASVFIALGCAYYFSNFRIGETGDETQIAAIGEQYRPVLIMPDGYNITLSGDDSATEWKQHIQTGVDAASDKVSTAPGEAMTLRISIPRGAKEYELMLDDGTTIWLNSGAFIEYPSVFVGDTREVCLSGEAFFDVAPDSEKPFIVNLQDGSNIVVHGTKFNVSAYPETVNSYITLVSGTIEVRMDEESISMQSNDQLVINRITREMDLRKVADTNRYTIWTKGIFFYDEVPLTEIFIGMERWYDIDIVCQTDDPMLLGKYTVKTSRRENYTAVLHALQQVSDLKYQIDGRTIYITFPQH